jgi:hypothetical protein
LRYDAAMSELQDVINTFTTRLSALIDSQAMARAQSAVLAAFGGGVALPKRRGRPPKAVVAKASEAPVAKARVKPRKKAPLQLCPVPGCKNTAAPIFGMVCAKHKDLPKAKIKAFRAARKAKKLGLTPAKPAKRRTKKRVTKVAAKPIKVTKKRARRVGVTLAKATKPPAPNVAMAPKPAESAPSPAALPAL